MASRRSNGASNSPLVIYIDDDGVGELHGRSGNAVLNQRSGSPQIKTEPSEQWWDVDAFDISPVCISDDEDGTDANNRSSAAAIEIENIPQPEAKHEDDDDNEAPHAEVATEQSREVASLYETLYGEISSLQPQTETAVFSLVQTAPMYDEETVGAEDNEPGLFVDQYEPIIDSQIVTRDADLDSLFSSPGPEPQLGDVNDLALLALLNEQRPDEQNIASNSMLAQHNISELHFPMPSGGHGPRLGGASLPTTAPDQATIDIDDASDPIHETTHKGLEVRSPRQITPGPSLPIMLHATAAAAPDPPVFSWTNLQAVIASGSQPLMVEAVRIARSLLRHLASPLRDIEERIEGPGWTQRIAQLQNHAKPTPVLIGIVGRTGSGKSSVINAVLDEDRVLPTNGLRACTAVVTEISWNSSDREAERYRAEIEFVQPEDWHRELTRLFDDVTESWDIHDTRDTAGDSPEASVALAKLRAVFPNRATSRSALLGSCSLQTLIDDPQVSSLLGKVRSVAAANPQTFYTQLQAYLDSSGSGGWSPLTGTADAQKQADMALWPLIKVVRVFLKSDALSTGVVLVDLPGFGDANAARDTIAERYISRCAAIWIVSPITRAVDDREARELLGRSFRRQLVLDGTYSSLSFICSKTDDISVREVAESLDVSGDVRRISASLASIEQQLARQMQHLSVVKQQQNQASRQLDDVMTRLNTLDAAGRDVLDGQKRAAEADGRGSLKRARLTGEATDITEDDEPAAIKEPCTSDEAALRDVAAAYKEAFPDADLSTNGSDVEDMEAEMELELQRLMQAREDAMELLSSAYLDMSRAQEDCQATEQKRNELVNERVAMCMQLRNAYSRAHIKTDFAQGQKYIDDESALVTRESADARKYDDLAKSLPVFCVSSRAYQQFRGRAGSDENGSSSGNGTSDELGGLVDRLAGSTFPLGYRHAGETEIPQLQQHARRLGTECLARRDRKVLTDFAQLLTSLTVWVSSSAGGFGLQIHLDQERRGYEMRHLEQAYDELKHNLTSTADKFIASLRRVMETEVLMKQTQVLAKCVDAAPDIATSWAAPRKAGGLLFNTYRSICRNGGFPTSSKIRRNFNEGEHTLSSSNIYSRIPAALSECQAVAEQLIEHFHRRMRDRPILSLCAQNTGLGMLLEHEIRGLKHLFREALELARHHIDTFRRDANRLPLECVHSAMAPAYMTCAQESGAGCMARMRTAMADHVQACRNPMYASIESAARDRLAVFSDGVLKELLVGHYDSLASLYQDCRNMIVGVEAPETTRSARDFVQQLLQQADTAFASDVLNAAEGT
ncbi:hypothetical protein CMQ_5534 [Grosmannia clavigera kw1407]|uniref:Tat pathway signal sequence n=1 Tax=Grosmannia clavigera (strain kw1407 / UAMH 11150) TaxID=655863 RepID=F0XSG8_GROCL|nr:uncharacterized protein CMQ_5534 [Grosmannia clavigera kw1407]EFW99113.1 hypothetical protein CMQ_5534 [Grosmannia clavigera kw1407]